MSYSLPLEIYLDTSPIQFPRLEAAKFLSNSAGLHLSSEMVDYYHVFWVSGIEQFAKRCGYGKRYEVLHKPCHLYMDIEWPIEHNPIDEKKTVHGIVAYVLKEMDTQLGGPLEVKLLWSTTATKVSWHAVIKMSGRMFRSNLDVGTFVRSIIVKAVGDPLHPIWVADRALDAPRQPPVSTDPIASIRALGKTSAIDPAVYTRNRLFRAPFERKGDGKPPLWPADWPSMEPIQMMVHPNVVKDYLVSYLPLGESVNLIEMGEQVSTSILGSRAIHHPRGEKRQRSNPLQSVEHLVKFYWKAAAIQDSPMVDRDNRTVHQIVDKIHCPVANRVHQRNRAILNISLNVHKATVRCFDPDCVAVLTALPPPPESLLKDIDAEIGPADEYLLENLWVPQQDGWVTQEDRKALEDVIGRISKSDFIQLKPTPTTPEAIRTLINAGMDPLDHARLVVLELFYFGGKSRAESIERAMSGLMVERSWIGSRDRDERYQKLIDAACNIVEKQINKP